MIRTAPRPAPGTPAPVAPISPIARLRRHCANGLRRAWAGVTADADARWLAQANDHAGLEQRLRRLERGRQDRFGPLPR